MNNTTTHKKPTIGVLKNSGSELCERWITPLIERGIKTTVIEPSRDLKARQTLQNLQGLLLPGGDTNIHPSFSLRKPAPSPSGHDTDRDFAAISLIKHAHRINLPTLGICRGMQEMVTAFGGRIERLSDDMHAAGYAHKGDHEKMDTLIHPVRFCENGKLINILANCLENKDTTLVNSIHYEGITTDNWHHPTCEQAKHLRQNFHIEATAPDHVIEAISAKNKTFFIGVQAHFELTGCLHKALFDEFASAIKSHSN